MVIKGVVNTGSTGGDLTLRWAKNADIAGTDTVVLEGSTLETITVYS